MERLTEYVDGKYMCFKECKEKCVLGKYEDEVTCKCKPVTDAMKKLAHYEDLAEQGILVDIEEYKQKLIRYIEAGKYRSGDEKVFSENDVVYLIEHGIFPCKSEAERALAERNSIENIKNT